MHHPFETEHLILRAFEPDDLQGFCIYINSPELVGRRYIPWQFSGDIPLSKRQVEGVLKTWAEAEKQLHLAVSLREGGVLIGHVNASWGWDPHCPNLDLVISPAYQRQGYGSEVLAGMLEYFFNNTPAHNITGGMSSWNQSAQDFAAKHGFARSGCFRRTGFRDGQYVDWIGIDFLRPEWLARSRKGGA
jgi:RimJ/RimL family protein N-acetyltransferase